MKIIIPIFSFWVLSLVSFPVFAQSAYTVSVDSSQTFQTFTGWEATDYIGEYGVDPFTRLNEYRLPLLNKLANEYGVNRTRLEIVSSVENPHDYFGDYVNSADPASNQWQYVHVDSAKWVNDDSDHNSVDAYIGSHPNSDTIPGFSFHMLDDKIDKVEKDLKQIVEGNGEKFDINLNYVGFHTPSSGIGLYNDPNEYAEFMLAVFWHMKVKYGFVPDSIEIELEPDNTAFDGQKIGDAMKATQTKLAARGFYPKYVVPSTTNLDNALIYFDYAKNRPGVGDAFVRQWVKEISYHRYAGQSDPFQIGSTAGSYSIGASMLECWTGAGCTNGYRILHDDLTRGRNTAWQEGTILGIYQINSSVTPPAITLSAQSELIRQYVKYIRPGATRIGTSDNTNAVAFINKDGKYVVVVKDVTGPIAISGLPVGTYGVSYATVSRSHVSLSDQTVGSGQNLTVNMPDTGVITIYSKASSGIVFTPTPSSIPTSIPTTNPTAVPTAVYTVSPTGRQNPSPSPTSRINLPCTLKIRGDADCNGVINDSDFDIWRNEFEGKNTTKNADFFPDGKVDLVDYEIWRSNSHG